MLIDLIAQNSYNSYNIQLAKIIGLHPAIYVNTLLNINSKAILKQKVTDDFYFSVDRNYVQSVTTFSVKEQEEIEKLLIELKILKKQKIDDADILFLDVSTLTSIMMSQNEKLINDINKIAQSKQTKRTKADIIKDELKSYVTVTNQELRDAYFDWIDAVYAKQGWMSKKSVISAQSIVDNFSNRNLDIALKLIEIASIGGYRDMTWAVNSYRDNYKVQYKISSNNHASENISISSECF